MKRFLLFALFLVGCGFAVAQTELWMVGTAVPGGTQKLEQVADGDFKYAGTLNVGELRIQTQQKGNGNTRFLTPTLPDANIVSGGAAFQESTNAGEAWQVVVSENRYSIHVDLNSHTLRGELLQPWGELFIAGGATEVGWKCEGKMLLMQQSLDNLFVWTWEGELRNHPDVEESRSFKFQGQDRWGPKSLHPFMQDTDILNESRLRRGGSDTKWTITKEGRYSITVDLLNETVSAKLVSTSSGLSKGK